VTLIVIDWGIGGLDAFARLAERLPTHDLHYLSDSGFTPWGKVEAAALASRITSIATGFAARIAGQMEGPKGPDLALVIACNAASTVVEQLELPWPVFEVIAPGIALLERERQRGARRLAVLGGSRTIESHAHRLGLAVCEEAAADPKALIELVAQPLSAHVEAGRLDGPALLSDLRPLLAELERGGCEAALLACTHYPALLPVLVREAPGVRWLDPVRDPEHGLVEVVVSAVSGTRPGDGRRTFATSGDPAAMQLAARLAFGISLPDPYRADLAVAGRF
jgi:glutamate racemase